MFRETRQKISEKITRRRKKIDNFFWKNKAKISPIFFFGGFVIDTITLSRIDTLFANIILSFYLVLALLSIILMNWGDYKDIKSKFLYRLYKYSPFITQFSFGALFSGFIIFYTTSATFAASWLFLIVLYLMFIVNERFRKYYEKFQFQITVLFLSLFAFTIFFVPIIAKKIGNEVFIASGVFSLILIFWIVRGIFKILPILKKQKWAVFRNIIIVFLLFNISYFTNIIPPVPLSVKNMDVGSMVFRDVNGEFKITKEISRWNDFYDKWNNVHRRIDGQRIYFFASVFAPTDLVTEITHQWEKYDEQAGEWKKVSRVTYSIRGGRGEGFRGYSFLSNATDGRWRVDILSETDLLIGRKNFNVINVDGNFPINLETKIIE